MRATICHMHAQWAYQTGHHSHSDGWRDNSMGQSSPESASSMQRPMQFVT